MTRVEDRIEGVDRKHRVSSNLGKGWWARIVVVESLELIAEAKLKQQIKNTH